MVPEEPNSHSVLYIEGEAARVALLLPVHSFRMLFVVCIRQPVAGWLVGGGKIAYSYAFALDSFRQI